MSSDPAVATRAKPEIASGSERTLNVQMCIRDSVYTMLAQGMTHVCE